jgi:hypothetical protein
VKGLRSAMEQMASAGPRIQLFTSPVGLNVAMEFSVAWTGGQMAWGRQDSWNGSMLK